MKKITFLVILISFLCSHTAQAQDYGLIWVESKVWGSKIDTLQFTVNTEHSHVCNSASAYCPNRQLITVTPNKEFLFNLDRYTGGNHHYTISDSCMKKTILLKPRDVMAIQFVINNQDIACEYFK
jgi:hypothetical protein